MKKFIDDLKQDTTKTVNQLIRMMNLGYEKEAWQEIERLHDEYVFFNSYDDDMIVLMTNEQWIP